MGERWDEPRGPRGLLLDDERGIIKCGLFSTLLDNLLILHRRPLTEDETRAVFEKLANYVVSLIALRRLCSMAYKQHKGKNLVHIVNPSGASKDEIEDDDEVAPLLRLQKDKVFLLNTSINNLATSVARPNLISLGQCLGKFTKSGKFKLGIGSLDVLARWARYKVRCECFDSLGR